MNHRDTHRIIVRNDSSDRAGSRHRFRGNEKRNPALTCRNPAAATSQESRVKVGLPGFRKGSSVPPALKISAMPTKSICPPRTLACKVEARRCITHAIDTPAIRAVHSSIGSLPLREGSTRETAEAAPVVVGTMLSAAARARRRGGPTCGTLPGRGVG